MIYQLVAILFVVTNGIPDAKPKVTIPNSRMVFASEQECTDFIASDAGKINKQHLDAFIAARYEGNYESKLGCSLVEDDSI